MTLLPLPTTPCWCSTTRAAVQPLAPSARSTPAAQETRTTTTSTTGVLASRSWQISTGAETMTESGAEGCRTVHGCVGVVVGGGAQKRWGRKSGRMYPHMGCSSRLKATRPAAVNSALMQLYSGFMVLVASL